MNALDDLRLHASRKMLRWCLNVLEKIVSNDLHKSLRLRTSRKRRLRESNCRKWPQFGQSDDRYLLNDNAPAYRSPHTHTIEKIVPHQNSTNELPQHPMGLLPVPIKEKILKGTPFCIIE
ncbi:hypothetical protein TNCV_5113581 [Trichonephila clavipes]|nr:hypothetical protein TNCV_5113581 [Trichonephila clavipes]